MVCLPQVSVRTSVVASLPQSIVAGFLKLFLRNCYEDRWEARVSVRIRRVLRFCSPWFWCLCHVKLTRAQVTRSQVPQRLLPHYTTLFCSEPPVNISMCWSRQRCLQCRLRWIAAKTGVDETTVASKERFLLLSARRVSCTSSCDFDVSRSHIFYRCHG